MEDVWCQCDVSTCWSTSLRPFTCRMKNIWISTLDLDPLLTGSDPVYWEPSIVLDKTRLSYLTTVDHVKNTKTCFRKWSLVNFINHVQGLNLKWRSDDSCQWKSLVCQWNCGRNKPETLTLTVRSNWICGAAQL